MLSRVVWRLALDERAARLRQTLVGRYWALVLPPLESGAFTLVFTLFLRARVTPAAYLLFVYVGVLAWRAFARASPPPERRSYGRPRCCARCRSRPRWSGRPLSWVRVSTL